MPRPLKRRAVAPPVSVQRVPASRMRSTGAWFQWPEELAALLGQISDEKLARRAGISPETVARERRRRGIESFRPLRGPVEWTPEMIALIGTESDGVVGRELRLSRTTIRCKRVLLGIPPYSPPPSSAVESSIPWEPEDLAQLGTMPDRLVAKQLGISASSTMLKRQTLEIPPFKPPPRRLEWTEEMLALLGQVTDTQVAELYGISEAAVCAKRFRLGIPGVVAAGAVVATPELIELLHLPGIEVHRLTGLSHRTIRDLRRKHGIDRRRQWPPKVVARLGREFDKDVARDLGVSENVVRKKRISLGIPSFRRTQPTRRRVAVKRAPVKGPFRWPWKLAARLGKIPDRELARLAGISTEMVAKERKRHGIAAFRPPREPIKWTPKMIRRLGTASDAAVARKLGIHFSSVSYKRQLLGIPSFRPKRRPNPQAHEWTPRELALLGKRSDAEVAEKLGISKGTVAKKRTQLWIPASRLRRVYEWTEELLALLGKVSDRELARVSGFSVNSVRRKRSALGIRPGGRYGAVVPTPALVELLHEKSIDVKRRTGLSPTTIRLLRKKLGIERPRRWTPELVARLGREPDRKIARELGIADSVVNKKRRRHGIPPFLAKRRWTPEELALVGTAPDAEIARKLGRTPQAVAYARRMKLD
ncbi:MAG TPA: hypothetical protein VN493_25560 [Thermoanaerobaculia bacterium]|nr:hypothetical protein [Thermoanaerobaculia bacterium]